MVVKQVASTTQWQFMTVYLSKILFQRDMEGEEEEQSESQASHKTSPTTTASLSKILPSIKIIAVQVMVEEYLCTVVSSSFPAHS